MCFLSHIIGKKKKKKKKGIEGILEKDDKSHYFWFPVYATAMQTMESLLHIVF